MSLALMAGKTMLQRCQGKNVSNLTFLCWKTRPIKPEDLVFTRLIALFYLLQIGVASTVALVDWGCVITQSDRKIS
jgi:hypothetical protein